MCVYVCVGQPSVPGSPGLWQVTTRGQSELFVFSTLMKNYKLFSVVFQVELKLTDF